MDEPRIIIAGQSHVGAVRENQEDAWVVRHPSAGSDRRRHGRLMVVSDGIGGSRAGEVASSLTVQTVADTYLSTSGDARVRLRQAVRQANQAILSETEQRPECRGMGCTVVAAVIVGDQLIVAWVGDSRAYLIQEKSSIILTRDHHTTTLTGNKNPSGGLTRWIGMAISVDPDIRQIAIQPGDRVLLCTDGLYNTVESGDICRLSRQTPDRWAAELIQLSLNHGAPDNVTVVCAHIDRLPFSPHRHPDLKPGESLDGLILTALLKEDQFTFWYRAESNASRRLLCILKPEYQTDADLLLEMEENEELLARLNSTLAAKVEHADDEKSLAYVCLRLPWHQPEAPLWVRELHSLEEVVTMARSHPGAVDSSQALLMALDVALALQAVRDSMLPAGAPHPSDFWGDGSHYALCRWPGQQRQYALSTSKGVQANPLLADYMPPDFDPADLPGPASDAFFVGRLLSQLLGGAPDLSNPAMQTAMALQADLQRRRPDPVAILRETLQAMKQNTV